MKRYLTSWVALCMAAGALFGPDWGAALATVVSVLMEVPAMLSASAAGNRARQ